LPAGVQLPAGCRCDETRHNDSKRQVAERSRQQSDPRVVDGMHLPFPRREAIELSNHFAGRSVSDLDLQQHGKPVSKGDCCKELNGSTVAKVLSFKPIALADLRWRDGFGVALLLGAAVCSLRASVPARPQPSVRTTAGSFRAAIAS
jgi:hypothetical protein